MAKGDDIGSGMAPTTNVALCMRALERVVTRPPHLPGIAGIFGPSGYGKSVGAAHAANAHKAYYIECRDSWSRKAFLENLLSEMRIKPAKTIARMVDQAAQQLALDQRPVIIDEADKPVDRGYIEVIRDLHEGSGGAPMLLIGEEALEVKLREYERFHNRVLEWVPAQPSSEQDALKLAKLYCPDVQLHADLLREVLNTTRGVTRRLCINLSRINEQAALAPPEKGTATLEWWTKQGLTLFTGEAKRRSLA